MIVALSLDTAADRYDVAILGGGLAGLCLALQLKRRRPDTSIVVFEKREGLAPDAAFKVGESTVPSGSHYFQSTLGLTDHLESQHIVKCGLRFFHTRGDNSDITTRAETGPTFFPPHRDFQIDRGRFENELARRVRSAGVALLQGSRVTGVTLGGDADHEIAYTQLDEPQSTRARWVVDATGRNAVMKRQLGVARPVEHTINSVWLRLAGGFDLESLAPSGCEKWLSRNEPRGIRWQSTNHLLGGGYWLWLIPLGSGSISIGLCADPRLHPFEEIRELGSFLDWLDDHEPQIGTVIRSRLTDIQDFLRVEDFAYGVERAYSTDRWCLVGEAAAFTDPFYSPGSDFIAYGNLFAGDLVCRDLDGEGVDERLEYYNDFYQRAFQFTLARTEHLYPTMGNPWVMQAKLSFDLVNNHSVHVLMMLHDKIADYDFMQSVDADVERFFEVGKRTQRLLRDWNEIESHPTEDAEGTGVLSKPLIESIVSLIQEMDEDQLREKIAHQRQVAEAMATILFHRAAKNLPDAPDPARAINPSAISLQPARWSEDGLFDGAGLTLEMAKDIAPDWDAAAFLALQLAT